MPFGQDEFVAKIILLIRIQVTGWNFINNQTFLNSELNGGDRIANLQNRQNQFAYRIIVRLRLLLLLK